MLLRESFATELCFETPRFQPLVCPLISVQNHAGVLYENEMSLYCQFVAMGCLTNILQYTGNALANMEIKLQKILVFLMSSATNPPKITLYSTLL